MNPRLSLRVKPRSLSPGLAATAVADEAAAKSIVAELASLTPIGTVVAPQSRVVVPFNYILRTAD